MDLTNENIIYVKKDNCEYIQFKILLEYNNIIKHAYSVGLERDYSISTASDDKKEEVVENFKNLAEEILANKENIVNPIQEHTDVILNIDNIDDAYFNNKKFDNCDGLITDKSDITLVSLNADCILLLLFDPVKKVIANVHSGWKGTLQRISVKAIDKMVNDYGSNPEDIICCMCPAIHKCHLEVEKDVRDLFYNEFKNEKEFDDMVIEKVPNLKWNIDNVFINRVILRNRGLLDKNIIDSGVCSVCNSDVVHSYRVEGALYKRGTAMISLY